MALAHNGIIRGLNAIYLQAPQDKHRTDILDFLTYCQCWCESMHHHHEVEEETFFPSIEKVTQSPGLMQHNVDQHRSFAPGLDAFHGFVDGCATEEYEGQNIRSLIEAFAEPLTKQLHDEIDSLRALDKYDKAAIKSAYDRMDKLMRDTDTQRVAPLVFGTVDRGFEAGRHNFPAVPFFVPYVIHYVFEWKHRGAWRFNPCTSWRDRRELAFGPAGEGQGG